MMYIGKITKPTLAIYIHIDISCRVPVKIDEYKRLRRSTRNPGIVYRTCPSFLWDIRRLLWVLVARNGQNTLCRLRI